MGCVEDDRVSGFVCFDRLKQLSNGLRQINICNDLICDNGFYDIEDSREGKEGQITRIDTKFIKAMEGGVNGVYRELVSFGKKEEAKEIITQHQKMREMGYSD